MAKRIFLKKGVKKEKTLTYILLLHALIFFGPDGVGKEAHAIELASLLNMKAGQASLTKIQKFMN